MHTDGSQNVAYSPLWSDFWRRLYFSLYPYRHRLYHRWLFCCLHFRIRSSMHADCILLGQVNPRRSLYRYKASLPLDGDWKHLARFPHLESHATNDLAVTHKYQEKDKLVCNIFARSVVSLIRFPNAVCFKDDHSSTNSFSFRPTVYASLQ